MVSERYFAENHNLLNIFRTLKYRWEHRKQHPFEFNQEGITIFTRCSAVKVKLFLP